MDKKILIISFLLSGCAHDSLNTKNSAGFGSSFVSNNSSDERKDIEARAASKKTDQAVVKLEAIRTVEEKRQDDKDAKLVLKKKMALNGKSYVDTKSIAEDDLYLEILKRYDENLKAEFDDLFNQFLKKYPESSLIDDVYYLQGQFQFSGQQYGAALKNFNLIIHRYPGSNRVPSAYYSKGLTLKQMHLLDLAKEVLLQTQKLFPGSIEARRAEKELKIL